MRQQSGFTTCFFLYACLLTFTSSLRAEEIQISVKLEFPNGPEYGCGNIVDPVETKIVVKNGSRPVFVHKTFLDRLFLKMHIVDPAGRLLIPKAMGPGREHPDAPPVPFINDPQGRPVKAAECILLSANRGVEKDFDLGDYYNMELSGRYVAQVHLPLMEFKRQIEGKRGYCRLEDYKGPGVLKSNIRHISVQGRTPVRILPSVWSLKWKYGKRIQIQIPIPMDKTFKRKIRVNEEKEWKRAEQIVFRDTVLYMAPGMPFNKMLVREIPWEECIRNTGKKPAPGQSYRMSVFLEGENGKRFCGSQRITFQQEEGRR